MKLIFKAKYLPMLARFMAKGDIRYYLNGIHAEPADIGGVYLVACDGNSMLCIHDKDGSISGTPDAPRCVPTILIKPGAVSAAKSVAKRGSHFVLLDEKRLSIAVDFGCEQTDHEVYVQPGCAIQVDKDGNALGNYPDWRAVVKDWDSLKPGALAGPDIGLNAEYLARFVDLTDNRKWSGIRFLQSAPHTAVVVQIDNMPEVVGIVMPLRFHSVNMSKSTMDWMAPKAKKEAKA